jgi:hypothetical protein
MNFQQFSNAFLSTTDSILPFRRSPDVTRATTALCSQILINWFQTADANNPDEVDKLKVLIADKLKNRQQLWKV